MWQEAGGRRHYRGFSGHSPVILEEPEAAGHPGTERYYRRGRLSG